jgi:cysteine-rich repeat protein
MANATQVRALLGAVFVGGLLGACLEPSGATCADGSQCAGSKVCAPVGAGCVDPAQVEACRGLAPGAACDLPGIGAGACRDEVCVVQRCGDGVLDPGEGCDDGEANAPDGACLPTCARPTCGDGAIQGDEACDDGELGNGDDRACLPTCVAASCGDGRVWAGVEACDAGAGNDDAGACTGACATASCGDGRVWAGVEACDDGNQASADGCRADCRKVETCGDALLDDGEACDDGNGNPLDGCDGCVVQAWRAEALVAGRTDPLAVELGGIARVAAGLDGSLTFTASQRVWRLADGVLSVVAGTGGRGGRAATAGRRRPQPFFGPRGGGGRRARPHRGSPTNTTTGCVSSISMDASRPSSAPASMATARSSCPGRRWRWRTRPTWPSMASATSSSPIRSTRACCGARSAPPPRAWSRACAKASTVTGGRPSRRG